MQIISSKVLRWYWEFITLILFTGPLDPFEITRNLAVHLPACEEENLLSAYRFLSRLLIWFRDSRT